MLPEIARRADVTTELLLGYDLLTDDEVNARCATLPRKIVRWLAINHPDGRLRRLLYVASGVEVGEGTYLNAGLVLHDDFAGLVRIGDRVAISNNVTIVASSWPNNSRLRDLAEVQEQLCVTAPVLIEDDAWLGAGCIILPGVTVGRGAVVGAGAVVTRDVAPFTIVAGMPARRVRQLSPTKA